MATVGTIGKFIKGILRDDTIPDPTIIDAVNISLQALTAHIPRRSVSTVAGDGNTTVFTLPEDFYWLEAIFDAKGERYEVVSITELSYAGSAQQAVVLYPDKHITFFKAPSGNITLYYLAAWPIVNAVGATLATPEYLNSALAYYGAAWVLLPEAVSSAKIRQYNTRIDSGDPEDNPVFKQVLGLLEMFRAEIDRHGAYSFRGVQ